MIGSRCPIQNRNNRNSALRRGVSAETSRRVIGLRVSLVSIVAAVVGCPSSPRSISEPPGREPRITVQFPEGDPSVVADQGGPGFDPAPEGGWSTSDQFPLEGSPAALKGGAVRYWMRFPPTLRTLGKDSSTAASRLIDQLCYESLLTRHSNTLEFIPRLATHWWISDDKLTLRYRINPRAHWSDGRPVTSADVIATWQLRNDSSILQPSMQVIYGRFERPLAVSKYLVEVRAKSASWRNHVDFATMSILPAHQISDLSGSDFLEQYQFRTLTGSGPYVLRDSDVNRGHHVTLRLRRDYWGASERFATGLYNFDLIRLVSTEDSVLALEKAKKGELDVFPVGKAKDWAVDLPRLDQVRRGLLLMRQIKNDRPVGADGIVINMRQPPLDDLRVRKALAHLYNRDKLIKKLFFGQYRHLDSYFPGSGYSHPGNDLIRYDPEQARRLLRQAGWTKYDPHGILTKNGRRLEFELIYSSKSVERYLSIFQEDCAKAGVQIHLKQLTRASRFQTTYGNRNFQLATQGFGGSVDPSPDATWLSDLATQKNNNNLAGFKCSRVDELCHAYDVMFDRSDREAAIREMDGLIFTQHPCILGWYSPDIRLMYWNKFGQPPWYIGRTLGPEAVLFSWWFDPEKERRLKEAKRDSSKRLELGRPKKVSYWVDLRSSELGHQPGTISEKP